MKKIISTSGQEIKEITLNKSSRLKLISTNCKMMKLENITLIGLYAL